MVFDWTSLAEEAWMGVVEPKSQIDALAGL